MSFLERFVIYVVLCAIACLLILQRRYDIATVATLPIFIKVDHWTGDVWWGYPQINSDPGHPSPARWVKMPSTEANPFDKFDVQ
jgi:hypothetical protein